MSPRKGLLYIATNVGMVVTVLNNVLHGGHLHATTDSPT